MHNTGYIYKITNVVNGKIYIGQTKRTVEDRFKEHIRPSSHCSYLSKAIQKYGKHNFKVEIIGTIPYEKLDEQEIYWINYYHSNNEDIGYNLSSGGKNSLLGAWNHLKVVEENLYFDSIEEFCQYIKQFTDISNHFAKSIVEQCLTNNKKFYGYTLQVVKRGDIEYVHSDEQIIIDWIKNKLIIQHQGQKIYCKQLNKKFDTVSQAAQYLLNNNLYKTNSKTPLQAVITAIGKNINGRTQFIVGINNNIYSFERTYEYTKQINQSQNSQSIFVKKKVYCPELDITFNSQIEAAKYFTDNQIWQVKLKTAKLRISDVVRGVFPDYKGYHFNHIDE